MIIVLTPNHIRNQWYYGGHMKEYRSKKSTSWSFLSIIIVFAFGVTAYAIHGLNETAEVYRSISTELDKPQYSGSVKRVLFPGASGEINIPTWDVFSTGGLWLYVSSNSPLKSDFKPSDLIKNSLPQADVGTDFYISRAIEPQLNRLFESAQENGFPLMMSSGYRSVDDQQQLYDEFALARGKAAADTYVADPGSSEHHTGLAIDLSDESDECAANSDQCFISPDTSQWLARTVHKYGFIVRYPDGKQSITGVAYEPWHYRYVGVALATKLYDSGLTFDEALRQIRPAIVPR